MPVTGDGYHTDGDIDRESRTMNNFDLRLCTIILLYIMYAAVGCDNSYQFLIQQKKVIVLKYLVCI